MIWASHQYYWADYNCQSDTGGSGGQIRALCEVGPGPGPQPGPDLSVLWLGNSYTFRHDVPSLVAQLAAADGLSLLQDVHAESSWNWELHSKSAESLAKIRSRAWDVVVLQEQSTRPAYDSEQVCRDTVPYLEILAGQILDNSPETLIQFYLTWARPQGLQSQCDSQPQFCTFSSMQDALTKSYLDFACMETPARLAPVGESFRYLHGDQSFPFLR